MRLKLLYNLLLFIPFIVSSQSINFKIQPFLNGTTSIKDGLLEAGPEFNWEKVKEGNVFTLRPTIRMPLTDKSNNVLQIDRFSSTWRGILSFQFTDDRTQDTGNIIRHTYNAQFEYGYSDFKYYPTGKKSNEQFEGKSSYAVEMKCIGFFTKGQSGSIQVSPQLRLRYSYDWKAAKEVGVVNAPNIDGGIITTTNLIIGQPSVNPTFSPAISFQLYPGDDSYSYSFAFYYDFIGDKNSKNPFNNLNRFRLESWVFFYPLVKDNPNVKLGITPFLSIRTNGSDDFNRIEYGGIIAIKFGTTFLNFF